VDVGQTVAASLQAPQLFVIANDLKQMQVETRIDEADIGRIRPGLPVRFTVDAFPDDTFEGSVSQVRLEPIVDQNVVTYTTVMHTRNDDLRLRPGMTANVTVLVDTRTAVLKVPNGALRFKPAAPASPRAGGPAANAQQASPAGARAERQRENVAASTGAAAERERGAGRGGRGRPDAVEDGLKPGKVYVLRDGRPVALDVRTGISDGAFTEVVGDALTPGTMVVIGLDAAPNSNRAGLTPPPGMGGPMMRPGGRR
jgi:HlyD family secretion protein